MVGVLVVIGCSNGGGGGAAGSAGANGPTTGVGGAPSQATDTNPANPHVTTMVPASPNGPTVTVPPGGQGIAGQTGTSGAAGAGALAGTGGSPATAGTNGAAGTPGSAGTSGAAGVTGAAGDSGAAGVTGTAGDTGAAGTTGAAGVTGAAGAGTGGAPPAPRSWPTVDCVGGPCAAPNVCVNLDFLFVACVPCGGNDSVCCPPFAASDPFLGTCDPGLVCASNPNFQSTPPTDVVANVCQVPGMPPPADGGLNHQRLRLFP